MSKHPADMLDTPPASVEDEKVVIRPYPKVIVYYPTMIVAFLCALWMLVIPGEANAVTHAVTMESMNPLPARIFFLVFFFNTLTIAFDFSRAMFISLILAFVALILLGFLMEQQNIAIFAAIGNAFKALNMKAGPGFFLAFGLGYLVIFAGVFLQTRFDYWEVKHNEILHHHGIAGDVERYDARGLRMSKEITDVFEYALLFSGRLVLRPSSSERPIILDHVVRINSMENRIERMLQTQQVKITTDAPRPPQS
jgi:hypothetical protein